MDLNKILKTHKTKNKDEIIENLSGRKVDIGFDSEAYLDRVKEKSIQMVNNTDSTINNSISENPKTGDFASSYSGENDDTISNPDPFETALKANSVFKNVKKNKDQDYSSIVHQNNKGFWNSDIIFGGVAFGLVLGVVLFYFQGLQPMMLRNYINSANNQSLELYEDLFATSDSIVSSQNSILEASLYNPLIECSQDQVFSRTEDLNTVLANLENNKLPKSELKSIPKSQFFYSTDVQNSYDGLYSNYLDSLKQIEPFIDDSLAAPTYLIYRNEWISACGKVNSRSASRQTIIDVCKNLITKTNEYSESSSTNYYGLIEESVNSNISLCNSFSNSTNIASWLVKWNANYSKIVNVQLNFQDDNQEIKTVVEDFKVKTQEYENAVNKIYNQKVSINGIWYFLNIEL